MQPTASTSSSSSEARPSTVPSSADPTGQASRYRHLQGNASAHDSTVDGQARDEADDRGTNGAIRRRKSCDSGIRRVVEYPYITTNVRAFGLDIVMPKEHTVNPTISLELARQDHTERLAHSHRVRVRAVARTVRRSTENIGRPPDPRRASARSTTLVDTTSAH
jgi:hypothetical protein